MSRAIIPGSFDPMTLGHKQVIAAAAEIFDEVVVLVMHNDMTKYVKDAKVKEYAFDTDARVHIARLTCADIPGVRVETRGGLLIDAFDEFEGSAIVKGILPTSRSMPLGTFRTIPVHTRCICPLTPHTRTSAPPWQESDLPKGRIFPTSLHQWLWSGYYITRSDENERNNC